MDATLRLNLCPENNFNMRLERNINNAVSIIRFLKMIITSWKCPGRTLF